MKRSELRARIERNLTAAGFIIDDLRLQPDPFRGWHLVIVSPGFAGSSDRERRETALKGLEGETFQWVDLLTPDEREWAGDLPIDSDLEDLPMWPEALARAQGVSEEPVIFPSDLDEDIPRPIVTSFYSLRGGVGRSTALAYTAQILASRGHSVLCVDMDLEAPALAALFGKEDEIREGQGLVSILLALDQGEEPDIVQHIIRVSESDELYCLPAGIPNADYARRLRLLDPEGWYREERNPLRALLDGISTRLPFQPDIVLMDARTGISPMSAPLLFDLSDLAVVTFFPHPQSYMGTRALVQAILRAHSRRERDGQKLTPEPRFLVSPIPASKALEVQQRYRLRAIEWIADWLTPLTGRREAGAPPIEPEEITHFVPYQESIATSDRILMDKDASRDYSAIAEWLERFVPAKSEERVPIHLPEVKQKILDGLEFSAGTAEQQEDFLDTFVNTELVDRARSVGKPLVLGRKGTGKTAIFRRIAEGTDYDSIIVLSPSAFRDTYPWVLSADGFQAVEEHFKATRTGWREFWTVYTGLASFLSLRRQRRNPALPDAPLQTPVKRLVSQRPLTERQVVICLQQMLGAPQVGLLAWDWLQHLDAVLKPQALVLFDGLDTGFGNRNEERARRTQAIEGLFSFVMDREATLHHMRFKILLREDIWNKLRFENKSHLYGRSVRLAWPSQADYVKTVLKQALRNEDFKKVVESTESQVRGEVDDWPDEAVFRVWNILVGERMKGGKTTFTRNWVWNRLADGKGDHSPRALLQLFREATAWEREEHQKDPYDRTVIRPRALIASLDEVSNEALSALREEFEELSEIEERLRDLGRSPVDANEFIDLGEQLTLAHEVGLVEIYGWTEGDVRRYRIPDLYRLGLGMSRQGPA
jgi:cellulose biosynthesis protein BcsQ